MVGADGAALVGRLEAFIKDVVLEQMLEPARNGLELRK